LNKEHKMNRYAISVVLIAGAITPWTVFGEPAAHGKTRAEVQAELVQARAAGWLDAPDASYPAVQLRAAAASQNANAAAAANAGASALGGAGVGRSQSGRTGASAPESGEGGSFADQ